MVTWVSKCKQTDKKIINFVIIPGCPPQLCFWVRVITKGQKYADVTATGGHQEAIISQGLCYISAEIGLLITAPTSERDVRTFSLPLR